MNSEIILSSIGQVLMEGRDNTPLGVSEEKDFHDFHESLQYFHLEWLKKRYWQDMSAAYDKEDVLNQ